MGRPLVLKIEGEPTQQDRPRAAVIHGHAVVYDTKKSKEAKILISELTALAMQEQGWVTTDEPLVLAMTAYFSVPKSKTKKFREQALSNKIAHTSKPDLDNTAKIYLDGMVKGGAMKDDAQVVEMHVYKHYAEEPRVEIVLQKWGETRE